MKIVRFLLWIEQIIGTLISNLVSMTRSWNIPTAPGYDIYISQLIHYAGVCCLYSDFLQCHRIMSTKLIRQSVLKDCLLLSFKTFFCQLHTDDEIWYLQLDVGSNLTIRWPCIPSNL
jgi:hypothetical protein